MNIYKEKDKLKTINITCIILFIILVAFIVYMNDYFTPVKKPIIFDKNIRPEYIKLQKIRIEEDKILSSYKVIDAEKGIYQIPIDLSIQLISDEYYKKQVRQVK